MRYLTGYDLLVDDLKDLRQLGSKCVRIDACIGGTDSRRMSGMVE